MTDYFYGVDAIDGVSNKPHGFTATAYESLTSHFEFIDITTAVDIQPNVPGTGIGSVASQAALDKLIQIVSLRGQPVIMGDVVGTAAPFTLRLVIEHPYAWQCTATPTPSPPGSLPSSDYIVPGDPSSGTDALNLGLPWPNVRANEDLVNRIKIDGVNYGFREDTTLAVIFNNVIPSTAVGVP